MLDNIFIVSSNIFTRIATCDAHTRIRLISLNAYHILKIKLDSTIFLAHRVSVSIHQRVHTIMTIAFQYYFSLFQLCFLHVLHYLDHNYLGHGIMLNYVQIFCSWIELVILYCIKWNKFFGENYRIISLEKYLGAGAETEEQFYSIAKSIRDQNIILLEFIGLLMFLSHNNIWIL